MSDILSQLTRLLRKRYNLVRTRREQNRQLKLDIEELDELIIQTLNVHDAQRKEARKNDH